MAQSPEPGRAAGGGGLASVVRAMHFNPNQLVCRGRSRAHRLVHLCE
jgi:hypothetical protein